jgi:YD repeat-containing protein
VGHTDALGTTKTYAYDALGDVTSQSEPTTSSHSIATSFGYDAAGNQTAATDGNGQTTYYSYTPWNTQESKEVPAAGATLYTAASDRTTWTTYDADGNQVSTTLPGGVTRPAPRRIVVRSLARYLHERPIPWWNSLGSLRWWRVPQCVCGLEASIRRGSACNQVRKQE